MKDCKQDCENYKPKPAIWQSQRSGTYTSPPAWPASSKPKPALYCRGWGQCTSLAKAESQPCVGCASYEPDEPEQPASSGVCYNHGCASQHDDKCFDDGSHFDPLRCTSRVVAKPAPEKSAVDRLREAGASVSTVRGLAALNIPRALIQGELVWLCIDALTLPRAEAALKAARGDWYCFGCYEGRLGELEAQLFYRDAEITRLRGDLELANVKLQDCNTELDRLRALFHSVGIAYKKAVRE